MKNKGFTLIELLAVIVILAIIALIATPIILGIINDAKKQSDERSIELYAKSIENQIAKQQLDGTEIQSGDLSSEFLSKVDYDGSRVECETNILYSDGTVYLSGCTVGGKEIDYTYGEEKTGSSGQSLNQKFEPVFYSIEELGEVNEADAPENPLSTPPIGKSLYLGYDVSEDKISEIYLCFVRNSKKYCLKSNEIAYDDNKDVLDEAFYDVNNACEEDEDKVTSYECSDGVLSVNVRSDGSVFAENDNSGCEADIEGAGCGYE